MKAEKIEFKFKRKKFSINVFVVPKWFEGIGLMFKRKSKAKPLLFKFNGSKQAIHSFFVFFSFYAIWMDKNFNVIEIKKVKPWRFSVNCRREFDYLLEVPIVIGKDFVPSAARRYFGKI